MPMHNISSRLENVDTWVFDLDNTLYPAECHLFKQIDARMASFIEMRLTVCPDTARKLQKAFYLRYGTTLSGLMHEHAISPDEFLSYVHDIDVSVVPRNPALASMIKALPGRKYIFTNGSVRHAENVITRIGIDGLFDDVFDIHAAEFKPKPQPETYDRFVRRHAIDPHRSAMFEDLAHNLVAAHDLGMTTVLITSDADWIDDEPQEKRPARRDERHGHVHHVTDDLVGFLYAAIAQKEEAMEP